MNKQYNIIHIDDNMYMVDKENKPKKGEKFLVTYNDESFGEVLENTIDDFNDYADSDWTDKCFTVLASSNSKLGLPILPPVDDDIDKELEKEFQCRKDIFQKKEWGWMVRSYKAASKKWTDEDMEKAMVKAAIIGRQHGKTKESCSALGKKLRTFIPDYFNSIKKKLIAVEVEMDMMDDPNWIKDESKRLTPPIIEFPRVVNNIIQIEKWIYEDKKI